MAISGKPIDLHEEYISSDGKPMAETEFHLTNTLDTIETLRRHFADDPAMYVVGNMFVHYERGNRRKHLAPDVFAVRGVAKRIRDNYLIWEEGQPPHLVIEFTSRTTRDEDLDDKFGIYRDTMGVREYFLFDPNEEYLEPSLQGFRLDGGQYVSIEPVEGRLPSEVLGLHLVRDGWRLRLFDPDTQEVLPTDQEFAEQQQELAEQQRERTEQQRQLVEQQRQLVEQQRQLTEQQRQLTEQQRQRAEQQRELAKQQRERAEQAEAELERLRQEMAALRQQPPPKNGS